MGVAREERHRRVQALDALLPLLPGLAEEWPGQKPDCMPGRSGHCQAEHRPGHNLCYERNLHDKN